MSKEKLLQELRQHFIKKDLKGLKKTYSLGCWLLDKPKRDQIEKAMLDLEVEVGKEEFESDLIKTAVKDYKYKIVKDL